MTIDNADPPRPPPQVEDTILATLPRSGGSIEILHRETDVWRDALAIVAHRPGYAPFNIFISHRSLPTLRAAIDAFDERVRAKHNKRAKGERIAEYTGHSARIPRKEGT